MASLAVVDPEGWGAVSGAGSPPLWLEGMAQVLARTGDSHSVSCRADSNLIMCMWRR